MSVPVSVVIPCHNQWDTIMSASSSAFEAGAAEIHTFDDYSTPPMELTSRITRPYEFHTGVCFARNYLVDGTTKQHIVPLDADDVLYPDALERLHAAWQPGTWVYGNHTEVDEDGRVIREVEAPPPGMLHQKNLTYATFLFHKDDWQRAGGYDPDFELGAEDYAFQVALTACGVRPVKLEGAPIYKRRIHVQSRTQRAIDCFPLLHKLIRQKWPSIFKTNRS